MTYKCFKKKISGGGIKNENMSDQPLVEELHKRIIRKFKNRKLHSTFIVDIWAADLADVQLISEYAWVFPLKDVKGIAITIYFFLYRLILQQILKFKSIFKMNLDLTVFIQEIIYLRQRMGHM